jgi:uncharacterized membrane protein (Fun14 family)
VKDFVGSDELSFGAVNGYAIKKLMKIAVVGMFVVGRPTYLCKRNN